MGQYDLERWYIIVLGEHSTNEYRKSVIVNATSYDNAILEVKKDVDNRTRHVLDVFYCGETKPVLYN